MNIMYRLNIRQKSKSKLSSQIKNESMGKQKEIHLISLCSKCTNYQNASNLIDTQLYNKYSSSQDYYYTKDLNDILVQHRSTATIVFKDIQFLDEDEEYLKRLYYQHEFEQKLKLLTEYYKFHKDISRYFHRPEADILNKYHDKKRRYDYYRIKQIIDKENANNPNKPAKGIVGDKPERLETLESNVKRSSISSFYLLKDITLNVNRGEPQQSQTIHDINKFIEDFSIRFEYKNQFPDYEDDCMSSLKGFLKYLNKQQTKPQIKKLENNFIQGSKKLNIENSGILQKKIQNQILKKVQMQKEQMFQHTSINAPNLKNKPSINTKQQIFSQTSQPNIIQQFPVQAQTQRTQKKQRISSQYNFNSICGTNTDFISASQVKQTLMKPIPNICKIAQTMQLNNKNKNLRKQKTLYTQQSTNTQIDESKQLYLKTDTNNKKPYKKISNPSHKYTKSECNSMKLIGANTNRTKQQTIHKQLPSQYIKLYESQNTSKLKKKQNTKEYFGKSQRKSYSKNGKTSYNSPNQKSLNYSSFANNHQPQSNTDLYKSIHKNIGPVIQLNTQNLQINNNYSIQKKQKK